MAKRLANWRSKCMLNPRLASFFLRPVFDFGPASVSAYCTVVRPQFQNQNPENVHNQNEKNGPNHQISPNWASFSSMPATVIRHKQPETL